nr:Ubiquitin carboxyl-terminal hydrolase and Peptidase C19 domain containing protein [Haemonchus contortus]
MTRIDERGADDNTSMDTVVTKKPIGRVTIKELNRLISDVQEYPLEPESNWYVVSNAWWTKVLEAARQGFVDDIPAINNSSISCKAGDAYFLRANLAESVDFHLLPEPVFNRLKDVYGLEMVNRDYICRKVISKNGKPVVEVYPRVVMVYLARDTSRYCELRLTGSDTLLDLRDRALISLGVASVPPEKLRFYIAHGDKYELIDISQQNIDSYFDTAQKVYVDVCDEENKWFINNEKPTNSRLADYPPNSLSSYSFYESTRDRTGSYVKGACGLQNLGNTCFMASALQCLSNVPELTKYFLSNRYVADINERNPLGTRGELARAYGDLLHNMWSGENCSIVPRKVKMTIGQFAPRFSGYAQQDSQELLAYVLDGLHEDLNRIKVKPYVPDDETLERLEEHEQAEKSWQAYKARNDSIIVDLVHGQLKSTLVCPVCAKVSIKFDPFCFLSVPLPPKEKVKQVVTLIFNTKRRWAKFTITMATSTTVQDAINTMKNSLQNIGNDFTGEIVVYSIGFGELSDEVRLLDPAEPIYIEDKNQFLYACQVDHNPNTHKVIVIKNQTQTGRTLSLPMVFTLPNPDYLTRSFLANRVLPFISDTFMKSPLELCLYEEDIKLGDEREQYKLFVMHGVNAVPFPEAPDKPVPWPGGLPMHTIVFQWKDPQLFNQYKGADLIDREVNVSSRKDIHLMECIDLFTKQEQLGEEDSWYCPKCKKHERASKKLDLWNLPQILIIHLKRFQYSKWHRDKIDIPVVIPVKGFELNSKLANERHEHVKYDLIAISHHVGGLGGGHYTATALNKTTGKWYDFNDSSATETTAPTDPYVSRTPYMLVYRRQEITTDVLLPDANVEEEMEE